MLVMTILVKNIQNVFFVVFISVASAKRQLHIRQLGGGGGEGRGRVYRQ